MSGIPRASTATPELDPAPRPSPGSFVNLDLQVVKNFKIDFHFSGKIQKRETEMATARSDFFMICFYLD